MTLGEFARINGLSLDRAAALLASVRAEAPPKVRRRPSASKAALLVFVLLGLAWLDAGELAAAYVADKLREGKFGPSSGAAFDRSYRPSTSPQPGIGIAVQRRGVFWGVGDRSALGQRDPDRMEETSAVPMRELLNHARETALREPSPSPAEFPWETIVPRESIIGGAQLNVQSATADSYQVVAIPRDEALWRRERERAIRNVFEGMNDSLDARRGRW